jgi:hypothetical protein
LYNNFKAEFVELNKLVNMALDSDPEAIDMLPGIQNHRKDEFNDSIIDKSESISSQDLEKAPANILEDRSTDPNLVSDALPYSRNTTDFTGNMVIS